MTGETFEFGRFYSVENFTRKLYMKYGKEIEEEDNARRAYGDAYIASKPIYDKMGEEKRTKIEDIRRRIRERIKEIQLGGNAELESSIQKEFIQELQKESLSEDEAEKIYMTELKDIKHWRIYHDFFQEVLKTEDKELIEELCEYSRQAILGYLRLS